MSTEYTKTPRSAVKRYPGRGAYDYATIHHIVDTCPVVHVSFIPIPQSNEPDPQDSFPATLPMIGCTGSYEDQSSDPASTRQSLYIHGYVSSRLMRLPTNPSSNRSGLGTPVTICATHLDGIVLALTPNHHSCNFRSAVVYGYASIVEDEAEKLWALERITNNLIPTRWENSRIPPTKTEMTSTTMLRVEIESASAKLRAGEPGDDKADLANADVTSKVWSGVVPVWTQYGEPIEAQTNKVKTVPGYLTEWVEENNEVNEEKAKAAAIE